MQHKITRHFFSSHPLGLRRLKLKRTHNLTFNKKGYSVPFYFNHCLYVSILSLYNTNQISVNSSACRSCDPMKWFLLYFVMQKSATQRNIRIPIYINTHRIRESSKRSYLLSIMVNSKNYIVTCWSIRLVSLLFFLLYAIIYI